MLVYVGTWKGMDTNGKKEQGRLRVIDKKTGSVQQIFDYGMIDVTCVRYNPINDMVYVLLDECRIKSNAVTDVMGRKQRNPGGELICYKVDKNGNLREIDSFSTLGTHPIDMAFFMEQKMMFIVNHGSTMNRIGVSYQDECGKWCLKYEHDEGNLVLCSLNRDGLPQEILDLYKFDGCGDIPFYQDCASPHSIYFSENTGEIFVPCRGSDSTHVFTVRKGKIRHQQELSAPAGMGPRNAVLGNDGEFLYVVHEIEPFISVYRRGTDNKIYESGENEKFLHVQEICCVSPEILASNTHVQLSFEALHPSAIGITPDGDWLVALVRGTDILSVFNISENGIPNLVVCQPLDGCNPREFFIRERKISVSEGAVDKEEIEIVIEVVVMDSQKIISYEFDADGLNIRLLEESIKDIPRIATATYMKMKDR